MTKKNILLLLLLKISVINLSAQNLNYYLYENKELGFSFTCPRSWVFKPDSILDNTENLIDNESGRFITIDSLEAKDYEACYNGIIFSVEVNNSSLDSTILIDSFYIKKNSAYYSMLSMSNKPVEAEKIKGKKWKGIHSITLCRIHCRFDEDEEFDAIVDGCENIYFSNNQKTVCFSTSGKALDTEVLKIIISSFKFI